MGVVPAVPLRAGWELIVGPRASALLIMHVPCWSVVLPVSLVAIGVDFKVHFVRFRPCISLSALVLAPKADNLSS